MDKEKGLQVTVDDTPRDTLTIRFWRDGGYDGKACPATALWACHIGENYIEGVGGFGATPLLALKNLCENIGREEGHRTDNGRVFIR